MRPGGGAVSPVLSGVALGAGALALPFVAAGVVKILYDGLIYLTFSGVRPPEEEGAAAEGRP